MLDLGCNYPHKLNCMYRQREVLPNLKSYFACFNCKTLTDQVEIFMCLENILYEGMTVNTMFIFVSVSFFTVILKNLGKKTVYQL